MNAHPPADPFHIIKQGAVLLGIPIDDSSVTRMVSYMEMLDSWGDRVNLTSITGVVPMAILHFLDSLTLFRVISRGHGVHLLDVGTGAGFPGLVLRIADSSMTVTLLDRDPRKIVFLKHVARHLELDRVTFLNLDLNTLLKKRPVSQFDLVVSRAFSSDPAVLDALTTLLVPNGSLIRMAGRSSRHRDLRVANCVQSTVWEGVLPYTSTFRRVILYECIE